MWFRNFIQMWTLLTTLLFRIFLFIFKLTTILNDWKLHYFQLSTLVNTVFSKIWHHYLDIIYFRTGMKSSTVKGELGRLLKHRITFARCVLVTYVKSIIYIRRTFLGSTIYVRWNIGRIKSKFLISTFLLLN